MLLALTFVAVFSYLHVNAKTVASVVHYSLVPLLHVTQCTQFSTWIFTNLIHARFRWSWPATDVTQRNIILRVPFCELLSTDVSSVYVVCLLKLISLDDFCGCCCLCVYLIHLKVDKSSDCLCSDMIGRFKSWPV
jgi:amino acid permease